MTQDPDPMKVDLSTAGDTAVDLAAGWEPLSGEVHELHARLVSALHERLRLIDWIRGLEAELTTLRDRYAGGDLDRLARRYDELQQRYDEHVEQSRLALARAEERAQLGVDESVAAVRHSATWRIGSAVLAPARWIRGRR